MTRRVRSTQRAKSNNQQGSHSYILLRFTISFPSSSPFSSVSIEKLPIQQTTTATTAAVTLNIPKYLLTRPKKKPQRLEIVRNARFSPNPPPGIHQTQPKQQQPIDWLSKIVSKKFIGGRTRLHTHQPAGGCCN